jgi:hypothetical protein
LTIASPFPTIPCHRKALALHSKNGTRYWGDFRSFADVGGDREPLISPGEKLATNDAGTARELYDARRQELKAIRAGGSNIKKSILPLEYAAKEYLPQLEQRKRNKSGQRGDEPLKLKDKEAVKKAKHAIRTCLTRPSVIGIQSLRAIGTDQATAMTKELLQLRTKSGEMISPQTVRRHLMELSAMFERATPAVRLRSWSAAGEQAGLDNSAIRR